MNPLVALYASIPLLPPVPLFSYVTGVPLIASIITLYLVLGYYHHEITTRTPNQLKRQLTAYEMPSIGWRDRLLASYLQRRPTLKWRVWQPSTIFKRNSILCAESPEEFALELAKQAEELSEKKGKSSPSRWRTEGSRKKHVTRQIAVPAGRKNGDNEHGCLFQEGR